MKKIITWIIVFFSLSVIAQTNKVGINTETPQATLHVAGTMRVDSLPNASITKVLGTDSLGNLGVFSNQSIIDLVNKSPFIYGESIQAGDLLAMGDGLTGYLTVDQQTSPFTSLTVPQGELVGQSFVTSSTALGIKAVRFRAGANQTTFTVKIRRCMGGLPSGPDLATASYYHAANNPAIQFMLVFDPPLSVLPNTQYAFIVDFQRPGGGTTPFFYSNANLYPDGMRLYSSNSGTSWTNFPSQDMVCSIFETQTQVGRVYKSRTYPTTSILDGAINYGYSTSNEDHFGFADRLDNSIGVAMESGIGGETKRVFVGTPCDGFTGLVSGKSYYLDLIPGHISITKPAVSIIKRVGFAVDNHRMVFD